MKKILIINPYYYPGYRSGGPQQTFMNIVEAYGDMFEFYVLTLNHDMGSDKCYVGISEYWNEVGKAKVKYISNAEFTVELVSMVSKEMNVVYAGGLFEKTTRIAIRANKSGKIECPFWIAPMGVFSEGAFAQKILKKSVFIYVYKLFGMFRNIRWSFTSELEMNDFKKFVGKPGAYEIACDIPRKVVPPIKNSKKEYGTLKIIFLSRLCPQKNLLYALQILGRLSGDVIFDIYGTKEDLEYWKKCDNIREELPNNITCIYKGEVQSKDVCNTFSKYDVFLFPTLGENFGHVIYEAMISGCVPVISDKTPWTYLDEKQCGNVISLNNQEKFIKILQAYIDMNSNELQLYSNNSVKSALECYNDAVYNNGYLKIFQDSN